MATPILDALTELLAVTKAAEQQRDEPEYYSGFVRQHMRFWQEVGCDEQFGLPKLEIIAVRERVADARRLPTSSEDFEHAVIDAFTVSTRLYRGLPGRPTIGPPVPKPKPKPVTAEALEH